jgi:hypothetical protein
MISDDGGSDSDVEMGFSVTSDSQIIYSESPTRIIITD